MFKEYQELLSFIIWRNSTLLFSNKQKKKKKNPLVIHFQTHLDALDE